MESKTYRNFQEFLDEFFPDDPESWEMIRAEADRLRAQQEKETESWGS